MPRRIDDTKLFQCVREEAAACAHLATTDNNRAALQRIVESGEARQGWRHLADSVGDEFDSSLVLQIVCHAATAYRKDSEKHSRAEIKKAGLRAAELAEELLALINNHATLQSSDTVLPILGFRGWTENYEHNGEELERCLLNFAAFARHSAYEPNPLIKRPAQVNADMHAFSIRLCIVFSSYIGLRSPMHGIVAKFASSVFDAPELDDELVKKWWQRRQANLI